MTTRHIKRICIPALALAVLFGAARYWQGRDTPVFSPARMPEAVLIIDAGHGGEDGGAVSPSGVVESHINLAVALRLRALMDLYGAPSILLRDSDISLHDSTAETLRQKKVSDLHNRVDTIEGVPNAVLISVHQNIFQSSKYHGAQVFFGLNEESLTLAQVAQDTLREALDPGNHRTPSKIPSSVYLMNHISCPAILVECGFLSNPQEEALLQTSNYQTKLAAALTSAYLTYQSTEKGETPYESENSLFLYGMRK